jgi:hypothetical protein
MPSNPSPPNFRRKGKRTQGGQEKQRLKEPKTEEQLRARKEQKMAKRDERQRLKKAVQNAVVEKEAAKKVPAEKAAAGKAAAEKAAKKQLAVAVRGAIHAERDAKKWAQREKTAQKQAAQKQAAVEKAAVEKVAAEKDIVEREAAEKRRRKAAKKAKNGARCKANAQGMTFPEQLEQLALVPPSHAGSVGPQTAVEAGNLDEEERDYEGEAADRAWQVEYAVLPPLCSQPITYSGGVLKV